MSVRVAIVGGGPKALHALERLVAHLPRHANAQVDVFEPSTPGAGPAYAPDLHPALLMNLRSELVDAWPRSGPQAVPPGSSHPTFAAWRATQAVNAEPQDPAPAEYASRATVGAYLSDALQRVIRDAAGTAQISVHRLRIASARPDGPAGWFLTDTQGGLHGRYDEVLLATGHGPLPDPGPLTPDARRLHRSSQLAELQLKPGTTVATRGFGLTTLDLVRLMDARGLFAAGAQLHAVSRTGRPPLAKPVAALERELRERCSPVAGGADWPRHGELTVDFLREVTIQEAARVLTPCDHPGARNDAAARDALSELEARTPVTNAETAARLRQSIAEATGQERPGPVTALGVAWRAMQAAVVRRGSFGGLPPAELEAFRQLAAALELVGFGPPVASAQTLLAALESGSVRVWAAPTSLQRRGEAVAITTPVGSIAVDVVVDTVLPEPGVMPGSLISELVDDGLLARAPGCRGVWTTRAGTARIAHGIEVTGLSVIGRPTEDWVLGNDTLSRDTHDVADQWATRVVATIEAGQGTAARVLEGQPVAESVASSAVVSQLAVVGASAA